MAEEPSGVAAPAEETAAETLEEWSEPLPSNEAVLLADGIGFGLPEGRQVIIGRPETTQGPLRRYDAQLLDAGVAPGLVCEATDERTALRLRHDANVLADLSDARFLQPFGLWERDGRTYLATSQPSATETLADLLALADPPLLRLLSVLAQVAGALAILHCKGWVHLGLKPEGIALGQPVQLTDLSYATRLGDTPAAPFYLAGYSAPELARSEPVDARADVYSVGALLYAAVSGAPIPETGVDLLSWQPRRLVPGVPQILHRCLGEPDTRYAGMAQLHRDLGRLLAQSRPGIRHSLAAATTLGLNPSRTTNEDAYACLSGRFASDSGTEAWVLAVVSDGMGGMEAGEVASSAAVQAVVRAATSALATGAPGLPAAAVRDWAMRANEEVTETLASHRARGGATLAIALMLDRRLALAYVGDSRVYRFRRGEAVLLTRDHSVAMLKVLQGELAVEAIRSSPDRNQVTRALGERQPLPDYYVDGLAAMTGEETLDLEVGDVVLLCSDGVWEPIEDAEMAAGLVTDLPSSADSLLRLALARGAPDNATVVLVRVDEQPPCVGEMP